ncbi:MAG TPA: cytidylate kinase-like family protein [Streptosporangiaceae bacterium]|nr:cytidylate kinase-like family protein [Streptosporangiaceae bacterium]
MPGVTISAGYGAGGSIVAPHVARLLELPLLDRAISARVAAQLHVSVQEAEGGAVRRSLTERFFSALAPLTADVLAVGTDAAPRDLAEPPDEAAQFRAQAEAIMRAAMATGAVILGRAGAAAFRDEPGVLRVRLFGPADARIAQAIRLGDVDDEAARQRLAEVDRARAQYVRRLYRADIDDPDLFHVHLDSTVVPLDACAEVIAAAYRAVARSGAAAA